MRLSKILIIGGISGLIITGISYMYFSEYIGLVGVFLSAFSIIIGLLINKQSEQTAQLIIDENRAQHVQIIEKVEKADKKNTKLENKNTKLRQLMNKVTSLLRKEHISKEELIERIDKPLYALIFFKGQEINMGKGKDKPIRDEILPKLGFKYLKGCRGFYILPPSRMPELNNRKEIEDWLDKNIFYKIPKTYRYIIPAISLVDLRFSFSKRKDKLSKRYEMLMDFISPEEMLTFSEGLSYLQMKKKISLNDLIELPNIAFLSENTSLDLEAIEKLAEQNKNIMDELQKQIKKEIFTRDIPLIDSKLLLDTLNKFVKIRKEDIEIIKNNAQFWVDFFKNNE